MANRRTAAGFTLIELLLAISVMALLTVLSWRGLDNMVNAQRITRQHADEVLLLQTALVQWRTDLDALTPVALWLQAGPMDWDGRTLRLVRSDTQSGATGHTVVAWRQHDAEGTAHWLRWQSKVVHTREELLSAWRQAAIPSAARAEDGSREVLTIPLTRWAIYFFRDGRWQTPPAGDATDRLTTDRSTSAETRRPPPEGVRLVLTLPAGLTLSGNITSDWLNPAPAGGRL